ncbi:MIP family channel protein [Periweissella fabaria]|uniref:Aquaporin Z 2 n=1 Tax=Periweissella fabaria TaxID=546157 RepID=A0ABN8BGR5_9LACO|nr:MIP family channel protein [Periweissella fabaria]MCM0596938.1 MIP family channel protein [Periweissella fabaria]CAH0416893.1 Aquaporin Z 2 [Periweissella fabaria]
MRNYFAEFIGTFMLIFIGTSVVVIGNTAATPVGTLGIGLAFGLVITVMAITVGGISGGHFNPAVTLAMVINRRLDMREGLFYVVSQFIGAIVASGVVSMLVRALKLPVHALGQTDFPKITSMDAFFVETLATFLFIFVIVIVTSQRFGNPQLAPFAIGLTLALLIMATLNLTGASLNPARSFGPAIIAGGSALSHYWVYLIAPLLGGALASFVGILMGAEK